MNPNLTTYHFQIDINAPAAKVWDVLINPVSYKFWTREFNNFGSWYIGNWALNEQLIFVGPNPSKPTEQGGLVSTVIERVENSLITVKHLGFYSSGKIDTTSDAAKVWAGAIEQYVLLEQNGQTTLTINIDLTAEDHEVMGAAWPKALQVIKDISDGKWLVVGETVNVNIEQAWNAYNTPADVVNWNQASEDWHTPNAINDLKVGGNFVYTMAAKDGSEKFDFAGTYKNIVPNNFLHYALEDGREVKVIFDATGSDVTSVVVAFNPETENALDFQLSGWQAILTNFANYTNSKHAKA